MNRWSFIGGLTVTLLLLLTLSGFCVWATRGVTDETNSIINRNYDNIRSLREMSSALLRINSRALSIKVAAGISAAQETFRQERELVERKLNQVERNTGSPSEQERVERLIALGQSYFAAYDEMFALSPQADQKLAEYNRIITGLTGDINNVSDQIVDLNESAMLRRRDAAVLKGRRVTIIVMGFAVFSLAIYIFTSMRLTRGVFEPLRRLRDSIQLVSARRFETVVPIEGGEELGQIASSFNEMARELQRYIGETDERALAANRICRAILETLPYPVYIVDRDFTVRQANPRAVMLSKALGIPGFLPGAVRQQIDTAAAQGRDLVGDDLQRAVNLLPAGAGTNGSDSAAGDYLPQIFRMAGALGSADGWAVMLMEVTRLRRNVEAKTKALATLSHEVKTPVAGIRMSLHVLLEEKLGALNANQRELLEIGRNDCERLLAVLQALLELARLESGRIELQPAPYAPSELLTEAMASYGDMVRRAGGEMVLDMPEDLPEVLADPLHASRVLANFISNANKYGTKGQPVVLRAHSREDGYVRLGVVNHGRAFTEKEQAQVFDPFFRRAGENAEGAGLGLAICREIAKLHGGRVGVFSPADSDNVEFYFDLRRADHHPVEVG